MSGGAADARGALVFGVDAERVTRLVEALRTAGVPASLGAADSLHEDGKTPNGTSRIRIVLGPPDEMPREPLAAARLHADDMRLRARLQQAGGDFRIVHGEGGALLAAALRAIGRTPETRARAGTARSTAAWTWTCEKCSDPDCEHRLFTRLQAARP